MNTILFLLMLAVSVAVTAVFLHEMRNDLSSKKKPAKKLSAVQTAARCTAVFLIFAAAAEAAGIFSINEYRGAFLLLGGMAGISMLICILNKKRRYKLALTSVKALLAAAVLEVTLFNIPTYRLWFGDYGEMYFSAQECKRTDKVLYRAEENDIVLQGNHTAVFRFDDIDEEVADVYVDVECAQTTKGALVSIDSMDETNAFDYRDGMVGGHLIAVGKPHSQYMQLHLSGAVSSLKISIIPLDNGIINIKGIGFNRQIPMSISWMRLLIIVFAVCLARFMLYSKTAEKSFSDSRRLCRTASVIITDIACIAAVLVTFVKLDNYSIIDIMKRPSGNQMTQELVEAFENGSTRILDEPTEELNSFPTPYTGDARDKANLKYKWDHVYYGGHYYSYYGIAPVVLLFLPYHALTGYYFPDSLAVLLFAIIGIIGLTKLYMEFLKRLFPKIPAGLAICGLIIIQTVSGIWFSIGRPAFYEIAMAAGFATLTWAVYFMLSAGIIGTEKPKLSRTAVSSLLFAVAVLCRPTLVLYCITAALFMLMALPRIKASDKNAGNKASKGGAFRYLLCAVLPMACIGLVQMWYNFDRFGNPFEFGIQYSLTINDFTKAQFHSRLSLIPIYNYFFNPPVFSATYPIISTEFQNMDAGGFFYYDFPSTCNTSGLFFLALPMFAYLLSFRALKKLDSRKKKLAAAVYIALPCLLVPFGIVASVWESGYAVRYMADFAWQSLLGAFAVLFFLYNKTSDTTKKKFISAFMCFAVMWALIVGGVQEFNQAFRYDVYERPFPEMAYEVQRMFAFWT